MWWDNNKNVTFQPVTMPSDLERAMETLITVFHRYAGSDGNKASLSRKELKQLMETELSSFLKVH